MTRDWFSIRDLVGVSGLPSTRRAILMKSEREGWRSREREGRGGGREYYIGSLPDKARVALLMRERRHQVTAPTPAAATTPSAEIDAELWATFERRPDSIKNEAQRKLNALMAVEQLITDGTEKLRAYAIVAEQAGESVSTIRNWYRQVRGRDRGVWAPLLAPKWVGRTKTAEYDERIYSMFRDAFCSLSRPPASVCYHRVATWAEVNGLKMPSYATLRRELERREDPAVIILERDGERALAEAFPWLERDRSVYHAMQAVNADGHVLDLSAQWPDGEKERATLLAVQDVLSGAIVGWRLVKSESAHEMMLTFLTTFDQHGIPEHLYLDNTLAAASKRMTAGAPGRKRFKDLEGDPKGVMPLLGVQVHFVTPAHGQAKPIERAFRTLADWISKHPNFEGAYLGNSTVTKPANYGARTISIAELEPVVTAEITRFNTMLGRRGGVANGRSYQQVFEESYQQHADKIRRISATQRRLLFMVAERVRVQRDGTVRLFNNRYYAEDVSRLRGTEVVLRFDPTASLHTSVFVYRLDGTLVAEAPIYHKAGFDSASAAESHLRAKKQFKRRKKDLAKAARRLKSTEVAAMSPAPIAPDAPSTTSTTKRPDFSLPTTPEQLGVKSLERTKRVAAAIASMPDLLPEPKRRRA